MLNVDKRALVAGNSLVLQASSAVQVADNWGNVSKMRASVSFLFFSSWRWRSVEEVEKFGFWAMKACTLNLWESIGGVGGAVEMVESNGRVVESGNPIGSEGPQ